MAHELKSKVSTDQPMREAEQSLVSKVNALIDAYWNLQDFYNYVMALQNDIQTLKTDMQAVKNKIGL